MSDDYVYHPNPFQEEDNSTLEERIVKMDDDLFELYYRTLIARWGINRHSSPSRQIKAILSIDRSDLLRVLREIEGK